jgi:hypothetical protein
MRLMKWLGISIGAIAAMFLLFVVVARFGDGPTEIIPGGALVDGELHTGPEPDWTFARDIPEMEFQLVEPTVSRTIWLQVVEGKLYVVSGYMNSMVGKLWKHWPMQAEKDPRAVIRIDGKRYERKVVRLGPDHPALPGIAAEVARKYGAAVDPATVRKSAENGDSWFFAVEPR